jgi:hypothetical protein
MGDLRPEREVEQSKGEPLGLRSQPALPLEARRRWLRDTVGLPSGGTAPTLTRMPARSHDGPALTEGRTGVVVLSRAAS